LFFCNRCFQIGIHSNLQMVLLLYLRCISPPSARAEKFIKDFSYVLSRLFFYKKASCRHFSDDNANSFLEIFIVFSISQHVSTLITLATVLILFFHRMSVILKSNICLRPLLITIMYHSPYRMLLHRPVN